MRGYAAMSDKTAQLVEVPEPVIGEYQALVKMCACGVCNGTDSKLVHHSFKGFDSYPALLGHEGVGEVVKLGSKVISYKQGDNVLLPFVEGMLGEYNSGWGGYCEYAVVGDAKAMEQAGLDAPESYYAQQVVPEWIDPVQATMIVTFREVYSAIKRFQLDGLDKIVVFGAGPVGLSFIKFLKLIGIHTVIAVDVTDDKAERAKSFGADIGINSTKVDVATTISGYCPDGVDAVIDAVGINSLINLSMGLIKNCGKICCYGISPTLNMQLDWGTAPYNWSINFVQWPSKLEEGQAHDCIVEWIKDGSLKPDEFISHTFKLDDIGQAFDMIERRETDLKAVITFE